MLIIIISTFSTIYTDTSHRTTITIGYLLLWLANSSNVTYIDISANITTCNTSDFTSIRTTKTFLNNTLLSTKMLSVL